MKDRGYSQEKKMRGLEDKRMRSGKCWTAGRSVAEVPRVAGNEGHKTIKA